MTLKDTRDVFAVLQANYPDTFRGLSDEAKMGTLKLWQQMFSEEPKALVMKAVEAYMRTTTERFMPNVGMIKEEIRKLTAPEGLSANEAWALVSKAMRNGTYGYREEYAKLPPAVQRAVGSAEQIHEWAMMDGETVQSVVASNFLKSYRTIQKREEELAKLPEGYRESMRELAGAMFRPMITEGDN